jgi:hypothetical protein
MKTFILTITEAPETRWLVDADSLAHLLAQTAGRALLPVTDGPVPCVSVQPEPASELTTPAKQSRRV